MIMALELNSEWIPGTVYQVVCAYSHPQWDLVDAPKEIFDKKAAPVWSLSMHMGSGAVSSDMYLRLKNGRHEVRHPVCFGDKLLFIEEVRDMRFRGNDIYYESYKKVLLGNKVLWLHKLSFYEAAKYVRFSKLRARPL